MKTVKAQFEAAAAAVQKLRQRPDNDALLQLYAFFKQATVGDVSGKRPGMMDFTGRAKFDAWAAVKGTSKQEAMQSYVDLVAGLRRAQATRQ